MTRPTLREIGEALYGPRWQTEISRELGVADRTVRRWATGAVQPPETLQAELADMVAARRRLLDEIAGRL